MVASIFVNLICLNTQISQISGLDHCINLRELDFYCTNVGRITGLDHCVNLISLGLFYTQVDQISGFEQLYESSDP